MLTLTGIARALADVVAPRLCAGCRAPLLARESPLALERDPVRASLRPVLCAACRASLRPIDAGACRVCGRARPLEAAWRGRCGRCRFEPRGFVRATVGAWRYTGLGRDLLRSLKFNDRRELARPLGIALARRVEVALPEIVGACGVAVVTAVPVHWTRRLARGFNQAELIARSCARELGLPFERGALARGRRTRALFSIGRDERADELSGAIAAKSGAVAGRWVLLVDDIRTSGSTLAACGRALHAAGAVRVDAAVVGR